jgi:hypothetical protein
MDHPSILKISINPRRQKIAVDILEFDGIFFSEWNGIFLLLNT